ncbi:hypothetical protein THAR02_11272, partial [Trichoderma harzianum]
PPPPPPCPPAKCPTTDCSSEVASAVSAEKAACQSRVDSEVASAKDAYNAQVSKDQATLFFSKEFEESDLYYDPNSDIESIDNQTHDIDVRAAFGTENIQDYEHWFTNDWNYKNPDNWLSRNW